MIGGVNHMQDLNRDQRCLRFLDALLQDLRIALQPDLRGDCDLFARARDRRVDCGLQLV